MEYSFEEVMKSVRDFGDYINNDNNPSLVNGTKEKLFYFLDNKKMFQEDQRKTIEKELESVWIDCFFLQIKIGKNNK